MHIRVFAISSIMFAAALFLSAPLSVIAQESDPRLTIDVPYSLVQAWQSNARMSFPSDTNKFSRQQVLALQYYLQSRTYELPTTGVFDQATKEALLNHQGGTKLSLTKATIKNINEFLAFLYCPTGQTNQDTLDYRLYNVNKRRVLPSSYVPNNLVLEGEDEIRSAGPDLPGSGDIRGSQAHVFSCSRRWCGFVYNFFVP
jgi:hypothetical protein